MCKPLHTKKQFEGEELTMGEEQRHFLVQVFDQLNKEDIEKLAFLYSLSPHSYKGFASVHMELLTYLTSLGKLDGGNIEQFTRYLSSIGREDVCEMIRERTKKQGRFPPCTDTKRQPQSSTAEIHTQKAKHNAQGDGYK